MDCGSAFEPFYRAHPDWFAVNAAGKPYTTGSEEDGALLYTTCINGPYYEQYIPAILREIIGHEKPDGFTDNHWAGLGRESMCYCVHCKSRFREFSGKDLPPGKNWNDPTYRQWIAWSYQRRLETCLEKTKYLAPLDPDLENGRSGRTGALRFLRWPDDEGDVRRRHHMGFDLEAVLPRLLPPSIAWAEAQARHAPGMGKPLDANGLTLARRVGVQHPDQVRIHTVDEIPVPDEPMLRSAAYATGFLGPGTIAMTLGYSISILRDHRSPRLLSHELRHVYQYGAAGSIAAFLPVYLRQIAIVGYEDAPLEQDARAHETDAD